MELNLIECSYECLRTMRKCMHQFARVIAILFIVDLTTSLNQGLSEELSQNSMIDDSIDLFDFVSNISYFAKTPILLLCSKVDAFLPTLISPSSPQRPFHNPAGGGDDFNQMIDYLSAQFAQRGRSPDLLRSHIIGGRAGSDILGTYRYITDSVRDIMIGEQVTDFLWLPKNYFLFSFYSQR